MGGAARAAKLSSKERRDIGSKGAAARWGAPRVTHEGTLNIGSVTIPCAVLDDGTRILSQSGFLRALGRSERPGGGGFDEDLRFVRALNLKPFVSNDLTASMTPISYIPKTGGRALGFKANLLPEVCEVYLQAREAGVLHHTQMRPAQAAEIIVRGLARVGIVALVDEATGYQYDRARDALAKILEEFVAKELQPWTRTFPLDFYREIFRLKGWPFDPATMQGPRVLGRYTNNIVYDRLAPGVLKQLRENNPVVDGRRKHKHFQWLTGEVGHPKLLAHLEGTKMLMKVSTTWDEFQERLNQHYPIFTVTELGLEVEVSKKPKLGNGTIIDAE